MLLNSKIHRIDYLTGLQAERVLKEIINPKYKVVILLMLDAGLRVSEAVSLQYQNFDFKKKEVTVLTLKKRDAVVSRTIPISPRLYDALAGYMYKLKVKPSPTDYLFPSSKGDDPYLSRVSVWRYLDRIKKKTGIQKLHPHTLRHTFATSHLSNGTSLPAIKKMLGHSSYDTTLIYADIPDEVLREQIDFVTVQKPTFLVRCRNFLIGKKKSSLINVSFDNNRFTVGRNTVLDEIQSNLDKNINTIIFGDIGVGKSHLLECLKSERTILTLDDMSGIKQSLVGLLVMLFDGDKKYLQEVMYARYDLKQIKTKLNRESTRNIALKIKEIVKPHEYILLIDRVGSITPKAIQVLEELKDTFVIVAAARKLSLNKSSFLWNFETIRLQNLPRNESLDLIEKLSFDIEVEDRALFRNHIFEQTDGNPRAIYEIVDRYKKEPFISTEVIRQVRHTGALPEWDMTIFVFVFAAGLAMLRYMSREVGEDSYRFIGGAAMVLLVVMRYFFGSMKRKFI